MITKASIEFPEVKRLKLRVFEDERGFFTEFFRENRLGGFAQDNHSFSKKGTIRGMHFQSSPGQAKLIYPVVGKIYDVFVDVREGSETFGKWGYAVLDAERHDQILIPEGFAHGFAVLSEEAHLIYKVSAYYNQEMEKTFSFCDPDVGIEWPIDDPILSEKDRAAPNLEDLI